MKNNKESDKAAAQDFLKLVVAGKIDEAYQKYADMNGKHHNLFCPPGFESLKNGMKENDAQFPHKKLDIKNVLADGDLVAVHSKLTLDQNGTALIVLHILRFKDGKIVELWDCGQPIPADAVNKDVI